MQTLNFIKDKYKVDIKQPVVKLRIDRLKLFPSLLNELKLKKGAEVGVLKGKYAKWLFSRIQGLKLFLIDPYLAYDDYERRRGQKEMDRHEAEAKVRLAKHNCEFIKKSSMEALDDIPDESLDFVYIDANHALQYVLDDILHWSEKVKKGGVVSGHDFHPRHFEVKDAVDAWVEINEIKPLFLIGDKTWFYIK